MKIGTGLSLMLAAGLAAGVSAGAAAAPVRRAADWTRTVTITPAGAYVIGNPRARVKLVEYLSLSCSHCATFAAEGMPALRRDYIARGAVSLEVRNAVRDGFDLAGVMLSRCAGPAGYFVVSERILATQATWIPRATAVAEHQGDPSAADPGKAIGAAANTAGFDRLMQARGFTPARIKACLTDPAQTRIVTAMTADAFNRVKIPGTPSFLINGVLAADTATWSALQPKLAAALR